MCNKIIFLMLYALLYQNTYAQYIFGKSDLVFMSLKGKVKEMQEATDSLKKTTIYIFSPEGNITKQTTTLPTTETILIRDEKGRTIQESGAQMQGIYTLRYIEKDNNQTVITLYDPYDTFSPKCYLKNEIILDQEFRTKEVNSFGCDTTTLASKAFYTYDKNGFITKIKFINYSPSVDSGYIIYNNDDQGNELSSVNFLMDGTRTNKNDEKHSYTYDNQGNWIIKVREFTRKGKVQTRTVRRTFIYY